MWWLIGGAVACIAFIGWIVYEMVNAPTISNSFDITFGEDDEDEEEDEQ